jgi:hypothetical protein
VTTPIVRMEMLSPGGQGATVSKLSIDEPMGSITSHEPDGSRRVYLFGFRDDEPGVWTPKVVGIGLENDLVRQVTAVGGLEQLSDLAEPFELTIYVRGVPRQMRFAASR